MSQKVDKINIIFAKQWIYSLDVVIIIISDTDLCLYTCFNINY